MTKRTKHATFGIILSLLMFGSLFAAAARPRVQMAILLDTSNSMDGLIQQAKTQLWKIVSELARAKQEGRSPELQVALFEYGKSRLPATQGYMRLIVPFSQDLDKISEELFGLGTNGGDEYCGMVIQKAVRELSWSGRPGDLKLIFVAGNEPFTQGTVEYRPACQEAVRRGITVSTIFCGSMSEGMETGWKQGADLGEGKYMFIDQNQPVVAVAAPQDNDIARLNQELNATYIPFGAKGEEGKKRQNAQDSNAGGVSPTVMAQRTAAKSTEQYRNSEWDLVDAKKEKNVQASMLEEEELPENMRSMTKQERDEYVQKMQKQREETMAKIQKLSQERERYVREQMKKESAGSTFDAAVIGALRELAAKKKYAFDDKGGRP